jgi:hypothetical protein
MRGHSWHPAVQGTPTHDSLGGVGAVLNRDLMHAALPRQAALVALYLAADGVLDHNHVLHAVAPVRKSMHVRVAVPDADHELTASSLAAQHENRIGAAGRRTA